MDRVARIKQLLLRSVRPEAQHAESERVRKVLVRTLFTQPMALAIGSLHGALTTFVVAAYSSSPLFWWLFAAVALVGLLRTASGMWLAASLYRIELQKVELLFELGAFTYAMLLGLTAAFTLTSSAAGDLQVIMVANALTFAVVVCARNAARPTIAMGQFALTTVPIFVACIYVGSVPLLFLAATLALLVPALGMITYNFFGVLRDSVAAAEQSERMAEKMRNLARTDVVTGLINRAGLNEDVVNRVMDLPDGHQLALLWIDLDRFKEVNDLLGHPVGDRVLHETAKRLGEVCPDNATIARFGGDEFVIIADVADRKASELLASEIHAEIMRPMRVNGDRMEVGASIGVALMPDNGIDPDTLMQAADLALYQAKVNGRKQTCFFDASMSRNLVRRREIEAELRSAIVKDELSIFFQPIVDLETGKIRTFEALVRWFHPRKGELRPDEFIPVAEETGVIVTLGNWITARAAKAAAQWPDDVTLAVNLSPLQIRAPGASLGILNALREAGLPPERLELEVTESLFMDDHAATEAFIKDLSEAGVRFALDDFGTGYSSLGYIHKYPFTKVKIDRSFVSGPDVGRKSDAIIHAVAEMGSKLDMEIVAEGIETIEQVKTVRDAGCTLGQGYHFSRAVPDYLATMLLAQEREANDPKRAIA